MAIQGYIFDTCVLIDILQGNLPSESLDPYLKGSLNVFNDAIVLYELYAGTRNAEEENTIHQLAQQFEIVSISKDEIIEAGKILNKMMRKNFVTGKIHAIENDLFIALSCRKNKAILITRNKKDFSKIQHFVDFDFISI